MILPFNFYEPVIIHWLTDVHMRVDQITTEKNFEWFVDKVNGMEQTLVVDTGDAIDNRANTANGSTDERAKYLELWNSITKDKLFVPGNRDFAVLNDVNEWAYLMGYADRNEVAGSKFNFNFKVSTESLSVEVISFDYTNFNGDDSWLKDALNTDADAVVFFSHSQSYFNLIENILVDIQREELLVYYLHGHSHGGQGMRPYGDKKSGKANMYQYLLGGLDDRTAFFEEIKIYPGGFLQHHTIERFEHDHDRRSP